MFADYRIANSIAALFRRIPPSEIRRLYQQVHEESVRRGMDYEEEDGSPRIINVFLRPRLIDEGQKRYFANATRLMNEAFERLVALRCQHPAIRQILPLPAREEEWFSMALSGGKTPTTHFIRWDANADFSGQRWRGQMHFFEVNAVGVGGIHYSPTLEGILTDVVAPALHEADPDLVLQKNDDARYMLFEELRRHTVALGRSGARLGFLVDMRWKGGPNEFPKLAEYARRKGFAATCCDSRDLRIENGEIYHNDFQIDVLYRDTTLSEFVEMEQAGEDMAPLRLAFARNQVVSGMGGELDHKSCFEIFSDPQYHRFFTPAQRRIFVRHVLWTRLIRPGAATDKNGNTVDLIQYIKQRQRRLLIKPNRGFGGVGIVVGDQTPRKQWREAVKKALAQPGEWVVQQKAIVHSKKFPILNEKENLVESKLNVVCGFIGTAQGLAILGRASPRQIVNVAQGGGMTGILMCLNRG